MPIRVVGRVSRPAAGDVVEEETCQIWRAVKVFACPFGWVSDSEPVSNLACDFTVHRIALKIIATMTEQTVLVKEAPADGVLCLFCTSADTQAVFLWRNPVIIEFFEPVGIGISTAISLPFTGLFVHGHCLFQGSGLVGKDTVECFLAEWAWVTCIFGCTIEVLCELIRVHHFRYTECIRETYITIVAHSCFATLATLGCNKYYTECGTGTIDRGRSCIFQYRYAFNIVRVNRVQFPFNAIDQNKRRRTWTITNSTGTTDIDTHRAVQCTSGVAYREVQTRDYTLQSLRYVLYRPGFKYVGIDHADSTGYVHFLLWTIAHNNNFIQYLCIFFHRNVEDCTFCFDSYGFVADVRNFKCSAFRYVKREFTIQVGDSSHGGIVFHFDGYTNHGLPILINHGTGRFYFLLLCSGDFVFFVSIGCRLLRCCTP